MSLLHLRLPPVVCHTESISHTRIEFYREEFLKVQRCLEHQRECFSDQAISHVECVLTRILAELEQVSDRQDADGIVEAWLQQFVCITHPDAWCDPRQVH
jgi:hypothetical protein